MYKNVYRVVKSDYFKNEAGIIALDYYDKDSMGNDLFSRKQVWFYLYGDSNAKQEFCMRVKHLFKSRFEGDKLNWDCLILVPTHTKGEVNPHMREVARDVSSEFDVKYNQLLERTETVKESHEITSDREKALNLEGSLNVIGDVEGKNIILIDNVSNTGITFLHAKELLEKHGAENVACVCLGLDRKKRRRGLDVENIYEGLDYSDLTQKIVTEKEQSALVANGK